jgi:hypothetical protein
MTLVPVKKLLVIRKLAISAIFAVDCTGNIFLNIFNILLTQIFFSSTESSILRLSSPIFREKVLRLREFVVRQQSIPLTRHNPRLAETAQKAAPENDLKEIFDLLRSEACIFEHWDPR